MQGLAGERVGAPSPEGGLVSLALTLADAFGLFQAVQGGRVKRYSSQRQRPPVPEPAPPMHISIMEGHYYDPCECFPPAPEAPCVLRSEQLEQDSPLLLGSGRSGDLSSLSFVNSVAASSRRVIKRLPRASPVGV